MREVERRFIDIVLPVLKGDVDLDYATLLRIEGTYREMKGFLKGRGIEMGATVQKARQKIDVIWNRRFEVEEEEVSEVPEDLAFGLFDMSGGLESYLEHKPKGGVKNEQRTSKER